MNIRGKIKSLAGMRCMSISKLARLLSEKTGRPCSPSNLHCKLTRGTLTLRDAYIIAEILDYDLEFIDKRS